MAVPYRPIPIKKTIEVDNIRSVYRFEHYRTDDPYEEKYPFWQVSFLVQGNGTYEVNGEVFSFRDGDVIFRKAERSSTVSFEKGSTVNIAIISFSSHSEVLDELPIFPVRLYGEERATLLDLIETGRKICCKIPPNPVDRGFSLKPDTPEILLEFVAVSLERFLIMILCRLKGHFMITNEADQSNRHNARTSLASEIHGALETRIFGNIHLEELAKEFGLSVSGLVKLYKKEYGIPILQDYIGMKMHFAKKQIAKSNRNFAEIAELLGFSSAAYFSRVFRQYVGVSPTEYSRMVTKKWAEDLSQRTIPALTTSNFDEDEC